MSHIDELYDDTPFLSRDCPLPPLLPGSTRPPLPLPVVRNNTRSCEDFYASESGYTDLDVPLMSQPTPHVRRLHSSHKNGPLPCTNDFLGQDNNQYEVHAWNEGDECGEIYHSQQKVLRTPHDILHWPLACLKISMMLRNMKLQMDGKMIANCTRRRLISIVARLFK